MNNKSLIAIIIIIILLVIGFFVLMPFDNPEDTMMDDENDGDVLPVQVTSIDANHFFVDGVHTIDGEIPLPTPCHTIDHEVMIAESLPEQVTINFTTSSTDEICTQVITAKVFSVSFEASQEASINATLDGNPVELNLIDANEGSAIDKL